MWEEVPEPNEGEYKSGQSLKCISHRMKIPGGWILRTITFGYNVGAAAHQIFVADPEYKWELTTS